MIQHHVRISTILHINNKHPEKQYIKDVAQVLNNGGVIIYPTDTIYGFGCDIFNEDAIERIYAIKKREKKKPFSFICSNFKQIGEFACMSNETFRLMKRKLPGPFTFILKASPDAPRKVVEKKRKTVGIRMPDHRICLAIVEALGHPIVTTSVNYAGADIFHDPHEIIERFGRQVELIIDGGRLSCEPSTVVDLTSDEWIIVRQGKGIL